MPMCHTPNIQKKHLLFNKTSPSSLTVIYLRNNLITGAFRTQLRH